jgi:hypothetical protein
MTGSMAKRCATAVHAAIWPKDGCQVVSALCLGPERNQPWHDRRPRADTSERPLTNVTLRAEVGGLEIAHATTGSSEILWEGTR